MSKKIIMLTPHQNGRDKTLNLRPYNPSSSPKNIRPITFSFQLSTFNFQFTDGTAKRSGR